MPQALDEGLTALKADARLTTTEAGLPPGANRWAWPQPGEMEMVEVAGRKNRTIYDRKIEAARLENVWRDSLIASAAVPFVNSPTIEGWPPSVQGSENTAGFDASVDDQGRDFFTYWADIFYFKLVDGIVFTLAELPSDVGGSAYWILIRAANVIDVVTAQENGRLRIVEARISWNRPVSMEIREDPDNFPLAESEQVIRIYRVSEGVSEEASEAAGSPGGPVHFREAVRETSAEGECKWVWTGPWVPLVAASGTFTEIPLTPHYSNRVAAFRGRPPFLDTASQQMAFWRKMLDLDERVRRDARNLIVIAGATKDQSSFNHQALWLPQGATAQLIETKGSAHESLRDDLESIRVAIMRGNLRPLLAQSQVTKTATEIGVSMLSADSLLEMWVLLDIASFTTALTHVALLNGEAAEPGKIFMPHDFGLNPEAIDALWEGYISSSGKLVPPTLIWAEMRRHQRISENVNPTDIAKEVEDGLAAPDET
jgi:hypothetical protein